MASHDRKKTCVIGRLESKAVANLKYTNEIIVGALKEMNGMITLAARRIGCDPQTIYNRIKRTPSLRQAVDDARGELIDMAEQKLRQAVMNGESWAVQFTLKTIGNSRGYAEAAAPSVKVGVNVNNGDTTEQVVIYLPDNGRDPK